jgi:hypothetical protein
VYSSSSFSCNSHRLPAERFFVSRCICLVPGKKNNNTMSGQFWRMEQQKDRRKNRWSTSSADLLEPHFWGGLRLWLLTTLHSRQDTQEEGVHSRVMEETAPHLLLVVISCIIQWCALNRWCCWELLAIEWICASIALKSPPPPQMTTDSASCLHPQDSTKS